MPTAGRRLYSCQASMTEAIQRMSRTEFVRMLLLAGYSEGVIDEILAQVGDPVDADRDRVVLTRYGVTYGQLVERLEGSP